MADEIGIGRKPWRVLEETDDEGLTGYSGRKVFHLSRTHMIGDILLTIKGVNGATENAEADIAQATVESSISNIKVVSGSKTYFEANGEMTRLFDTYYSGRNPYEVRSQYPSLSQEALFPIHFGRFPGDERVILPAPLDKKLDLIIEYAFTQSDTEGFASSGHEFSVYLNALSGEDEDLMSKRILTTTHQDDYTTSSAGTKTFDLTIDPRRYLRALYLQSYQTLICENVDITHAKMVYDNDEVMSGSWEQWQRKNADDCKLNLVKYIQTYPSSSTDEIKTRIPGLTGQSGVQAMYSEQSGAVTEYINSITADEIVMANSAADIEGMLMLRSEVLPTVIVLDLDTDNTMGRVISQARTGKLIITDSASGGAVKLYEQSLESWHP